MNARTATLDGNRSPMADGFFAWWGDELAGFWPGRSRQLPEDDFGVAHFDGGRLHFVACSGDGIEDLAVVDLPGGERGMEPNAALLAQQIKRSRLPIILRLAPDLGIIVADRLPAAAKDDLRQIIANRLDGLTPWSAEHAVFDTISIDKLADGVLDVVLAVAPRRTILRALDALAELNLPVEAIDIGDLADPYAPPSHDLGHDSRRRKLPIGVPIFAGLLVFAAVAAGIAAFFDLQTRQAALEQRRTYAAVLEERLADLPALMGEIDRLKSAGQAVLERHLAQPSALVTIETLTRIMPDSVWLEAMNLAENELQITGYADDASTLPAILEQSAAFEAARFAAPSERLFVPRGLDEMIEVDRFSITAAVHSDGRLTR